MAYLPSERIAFEADLFDTHEPPPSAPTPAMRSLFNQVQRMKLDVATLAPVHGNPVPWSAFLKAMGVTRHSWLQAVASGLLFRGRKRNCATTISVRQTAAFELDAHTHPPQRDAAPVECRRTFTTGC